MKVSRPRHRAIKPRQRISLASDAAIGGYACSRRGRDSGGYPSRLLGHGAAGEQQELRAGHEHQEERVDDGHGTDDQLSGPGSVVETRRVGHRRRM
jgi:hypothetical protein